VLALASLVPAWSAFCQPAPEPSTLECTQLALAEVAAPRAVAVPPREVRSEPVAPYGECWLDLAAAQAWGGGTPTFVDVRPASEMRGVRIAGALQIPLSDLAGKSFLKNTPVVLIGSGFDDAELARACAELKRSGFVHARLLRGGVRAWSAAGQPLAVVGPAQPLDVIGPGEFHRHAFAAPWLVIGIDVRADDDLPSMLATLRRVEANASAPRAVAAVVQARAEITDTPAAIRPSAVVIVARDGSSGAKWYEAIRRERLPDVLFLDGGLIGYQRFLSEQQSIAASAGKPLTRPCGSG
jgi:rhodanese-related sulfurtransferase